MATSVGYTNGLMNGELRSATTSVGRFLLHFLEMLVAMMIGMGIYHVVARKPPEAYLVLWYAGMEFSMIPPMVALMLHQGHGWRNSAEMAGAMLIGPAVFLTCAQLGLHTYIPGLSVNTLLRLSDPTMILGMLAAMLYRREMYMSSLAGHRHVGHAEHAAHAH